MLPAFLRIPAASGAVLLAACAGPALQQPWQPDTAAPDTSAPDTATPLPGNVADVLGDCGGYQDTPGAYPNQLASGTELQRYTLTDPEALCNDGTPAVLYVRPATDEALAGVWSLHLQGGGSCSSFADCAIRWCGLEYYDRSKMSSQGLPLTIAGAGIYDASARNLLAGANQVYFYYCSSDGWNGQGRATYTGDDLTGADRATIPFEAGDFTLYRRGHTILSAALDALSEGITADDGLTMPALSDASLVLFSGTSAGSSGARHNADYVSARLSEARVVAIFDAANTVPSEFLPAKYQAELDALQSNAWTKSLATEDTTPFRDESCVAALGGTDDEWRCVSADYLPFHHITTPFFMRQDLRDPPNVIGMIGVTEDEHEQAVADMLGSLAALPSTATEGADIGVVPGAFGPNCGQHVALESTTWWAGSPVTDSNGTDTTFQDAVLRWVQGADTAVIDAPVSGSGSGPASSCGDLNDQN